MRRLKLLYGLGGLVCAIIVINFIVFVVVTTYVGGDAVNGKVEKGHYYLFGLTAKGVKGYNEVNEATFTYSKYHVYSIFITWPILFVVGFFCRKLKERIKRLESERIPD